VARKPRVEFPGALYHVINRGNNKRAIFRDDKDRTKFLMHLEKCKERYPFRLYAFVLMPNHIHLLIEREQNSVSRIMQ
jgi:REP element-mobilizing transposase RayT